MTEKPTYEELEHRVRDLEQAATERELKDDIYRKTHELLPFFIKHSPIYAFIKEIFEKESNVIYVSDNYVDMIGIPASQMVGKNMYELFPHEFAEKMTQDDIDVIERGLNLRLHEELNDRNYVTYKFPLTQGDKKYLAGYTVDITELKQAEKQLDESEKKYRLLFENASQGIGYWTTDAKVISFNKIAAEDMRGAPNEFVGKSAIELFGYEQGTIFTDRIKNVVETNQQQNYEDTVELASGEKTFISSYNAVLNYDGEILGVQIISTEITEQSKLQKNLKKSEERFRKLFESSPLPTFVWSVNNGDFYLEEINKAVDKLTYRKGEQFIGLSANEIYLDRPDILEHFNNCITEKKVIVINTEYLSRGKGLKRQIIFTFVYISDEILMLHADDITEDKQTEDNLKDNLSFLETLIETIPIPLFCKNVKGEYSIVNRALEEFYGKNREEIIGKTVYDLGPKHLADKYYEKDLELFQSQGVQVYEWKVINAAGETREVIFRKACYTDREGKIIGLIGTISDITGRKKAEKVLIEERARLKGALESMSDAVFISDADGNFVEFNEAFATFHRLHSKEECLLALAEWNSILDVYSDDGKLLPLDMWLVSRALRGEQGINEIYKLKRRDTGETWFGRYNFAPIYNKEGGVAGSVVVAHDITERRQIQAQLAQAQKMEAVGNLAGGIAHDFNNILSSIIGFTELALEAAPQGSSQRDDLEEVYIAGNRAKELVQQILAFARQSEKETKPIRLSDIITEALKLLRPTTPTNIDIKPTINSTAKVIGNPSQIHQIVMNLCTNAIHSLQETGGTLEIDLRNTYLANDSASKISGLSATEYAQLTVTDNGPGIDPATIEHIFEPYFTTKGIGEGTGMGLAMVKGIIESYSGDIRVTSEPGEKTSFIIRLPIAAKRSSEAAVHVNPVASGTECILFVDDEPPIARMGSRMLESLGYTVTIRTSSFEALELFKEKPDSFDLVITDMTMPSMTGDVLSVELRKIRQNIPIILCTGYSNKIDDERAKQIGIDAFAYKPITKADLAKTIREVLEKYRTT